MRNLSSRFFFFFEFLKGENRSFDYVYIVSFVIEVLEIFKRDFFREMIIDLNVRNRYEFRFLLFRFPEFCENLRVVFVICTYIYIEIFRRNFSRNFFRQRNDYRFECKKSIRV